MSELVVIFGCGGQGREVGRMLIDAGHVIVGYVDDSPTEANLARVATQGIRFLGAREALAKCGAGRYVLGISSGTAREVLSLVAEENGLTPLTFIHPESTVGSDCVIGQGSILWPGARLTTNVRLGRQVHVNQNVTIGHDSELCDYSTINPSAAVSGNVRIGERSLVGAASVVLQGLHVGAGSTVGAAACLTRDLPGGTVAAGVPARWKEGS